MGLRIKSQTGRFDHYGVHRVPVGMNSVSCPNWLVSIVANYNVVRIKL